MELIILQGRRLGRQNATKVQEQTALCQWHKWNRVHNVNFTFTAGFLFFHPATVFLFNHCSPPSLPSWLSPGWSTCVSHEFLQRMICLDSVGSYLFVLGSQLCRARTGPTAAAGLYCPSLLAPGFKSKLSNSSLRRPSTEGYIGKCASQEAVTMLQLWHKVSNALL